MIYLAILSIYLIKNDYIIHFRLKMYHQLLNDLIYYHSTEQRQNNFNHCLFFNNQCHLYR
jgi:hypothetical protein